MSKRKKTSITILIIISALVVTLGLTAYFLFLHRYKGNPNTFTFNTTDTFDIDSIPTITKKKDKDFVILNLTDIQISDGDIFTMEKEHKIITELVNKTNPDLITLTGDQVWSNENHISLLTIIGWLDSYEIPYCPVFGNHDYGNDYNSAVCSEAYSCELYEKGKYSLFQTGPNNIGSLGNYCVNIEEDGNIIKTLYFLNNGYIDEFTQGQYDYFKWISDGIENEVGYYPESMLFMHKPIDTFEDAFSKSVHCYYSGGGWKCDIIDETKVLSDFPIIADCVLSCFDDNIGFYDMLKDRNLKDIVCGHEHTNNFTILNDDDIRLTFARKSSEYSFYAYKNDTYYVGGTYFVINSSSTTVKNISVDYDRFHYRDSD